jgi:DNA-binding FadR family transcriptional regulator
MAAVRGDGDMLSAKVAFHRLILEATGNRLYRGLTELVTTALTLSAAFANRNRRPPDAAGYAALGAALVAGEPERARAAMRAIVAEVLRQVAAHQDGERPAGLERPWSGLAPEPVGERASALALPG